MIINGPISFWENWTDGKNEVGNIQTSRHMIWSKTWTQLYTLALLLKSGYAKYVKVQGDIFSEELNNYNK
jgi:hypothetical protein